MSCEEEVISVRKQLEKMSKEGDDQTQALDLLKALGKLPINLQVLTNTRCVSCLSPKMDMFPFNCASNRAMCIVNFASGR